MADNEDLIKEALAQADHMDAFAAFPTPCLYRRLANALKAQTEREKRFVEALERARDQFQSYADEEKRTGKLEKSATKLVFAAALETILGAYRND